MLQQGVPRPSTRSAEESDGARRVARDLPVPKGARIRTQAPVEATAIATVMLSPSPPPTASFEALPNSPETEPPDTNGAVGRNHLMVTLNSEVRIQDRSGAAVSTVTLGQFWQRVSPGEPFDPKVLYDPFADRWITTAAGNFFRSLLVGVSRSGDPTGSWNLYRIDTPPFLIDAPSVGFNKNWIVVTSAFFTEFPPMTTRQWVFGKANLYAGGSGSFTAFDGRVEEVGGVAATTLDPTISTLYFLQNRGGNVEGKGVLRLYTLTGPIGSEVLTPVTFIATPDPWSNEGPGCPQKGALTRIICFGGSDVVFRNGTIWWAHVIWLPADAPTRNAVQWWQLTPEGGILQRGRLEDSSGIRWYGFPSLAVNGSGDVLIGFSSFSENQFASASYAYRAASDPPGTLREERVYKAGEDVYVRDEVQHGANRWGDYSATTVDPVNDTDLWTIQEYAMTMDASNPTRGGASVASRWGTWWARVVPEPAAVDRIAPQPPARTRTPRAVPPRGQ